MAKSLVLVVGAGASREVGLPIGAELKSAIVQNLNSPSEFGRLKFEGDNLILGVFRALSANQQGSGLDIDRFNRFLNAAHRITVAMPQAISIDNFIDSHRDEVISQCGKVAITHCILAAERKCCLFVDPSNSYNQLNFRQIPATWFDAFFQLINENCQKEKLRERVAEVAIVCFNYDRCVEHYLHAAFRNYYGMSEFEATDILSALAIYHPYGSVGKLPWQDPEAGIIFGGIPTSEDLIELAEGIRTFTEGIDPKLSDIEEIRGSIGSAKILAFLGFAYHSLNLKLLFADLPPHIASGCQVYGTAHGISHSDVMHISGELGGLGNIPREHFHLHNDLKCAGLFREYWKTFASSLEASRSSWFATPAG